MEIYMRLPRELCAIVRSYFYTWQRFGLQRPPVIPNPKNAYAYYAKFRHAPRGFRWRSASPTFFYRRVRDTFQWQVSVPVQDYTQDVYLFSMYPQWAYTDHTKELAKSLLRDQFYLAVPPPPFADLDDVYLVNDYEMEFVLIISRPTLTSPPTRQECTIGLCNYVKRLADEVARSDKSARASLSSSRWRRRYAGEGLCSSS